MWEIISAFGFILLMAVFFANAFEKEKKIEKMFELRMSLTDIVHTILPRKVCGVRICLRSNDASQHNG